MCYWYPVPDALHCTAYHPAASSVYTLHVCLVCALSKALQIVVPTCVMVKFISGVLIHVLMSL